MLNNRHLVTLQVPRETSSEKSPLTFNQFCKFRLLIYCMVKKNHVYIQNIKLVDIYLINNNKVKSHDQYRQNVCTCKIKINGKDV